MTPQLDARDLEVLLQLPNSDVVKSRVFALAAEKDPALRLARLLAEERMITAKNFVFSLHHYGVRDLDTNFNAKFTIQVISIVFLSDSLTEPAY